MKLHRVVILILTLTTAFAVKAEDDIPEDVIQRMTVERLDGLIQRIDDKAERSSAGNQWQLSVNERLLIVIIDVEADRMRIMTPIVESDGIGPEMMSRLMQANFDSALDARYAVAQGVLWGAFIHPLSDLSGRLFLSGVGQVVNVAETFGTTFTSGALLFGGGDSADMQRELLKRLLELEKQNEA